MGSIKAKISGGLYAGAVAAYFLLGILQLAAIYSGIKAWLGWPSFICIIIGLVVAYIPLIGSGCGVWGAMVGWGWSLWAGLALYFWWLPLSLVWWAIVWVSGKSKQNSL